jgi:hypothetical protein
MLIVQAFGLLPLVWLLLTPHSGFDPFWEAVYCLLGFFTTAQVCHGELARDRPPTRYLTEFYLWMSVGGMVGGLFNAIFSPLMFTWLLELPVAVVLAGLLRPTIAGGGWTETWIATTWPEVANWFNKVGDDIYNQFNKQPEAPPAVGAAPAPAPVVHHGPRGWLMGLTFDLLLVLLVTALAWVFIANGEGGWGWKSFYNLQHPDGIKLTLKENSMFYFFNKTLGKDLPDTVWWTERMAPLLMFGLPLLLAALMMSRPLRYGLTIAGVLLVLNLHEANANKEKVLAAERSYFGVLRVLRQNPKGDFGESHYLMHGTTHHGLNYQPGVEVPVFDVKGDPVLRKEGAPAKDQEKQYEMRPLERIATTYYHRLGPAGVVMEKLNWFNGQYGIVKKDKEGKEELDDQGRPKLEYRVNYRGTFNDYSADARLPAAVWGLGAAGPLAQLGAAMSEPPFATIGLGTGTMASYGRPFQHVVYYEIDDRIRQFSLRNSPYFTYVQEAIKRGVKLEIIMGDARLSMAEERLQPDTTYTWQDRAIMKSTSFPKRQHYYRAIVVDAFSSDAIPVHLITKEAIAMYMSKLIKHRNPVLVEKEPYVKDRYDGKGKYVLDAWGQRMPNFKRDNTRAAASVAAALGVLAGPAVPLAGAAQTVPQAQSVAAVKPGKTIDEGCHGGILCVHTSNRHVDLVKPVTDVAKKLELRWRVGKDHTDRRSQGKFELPVDRFLHIGHFGQEYVMIAEHISDLPPKTPRGEGSGPINPGLFWRSPQAPGNRVWTDDYSNLMSVFRWGRSERQEQEPPEEPD